MGTSISKATTPSWSRATLVLLVAAALTLQVGTGVVAYASRYQPLVEGSAGGLEGGHSAGFGGSYLLAYRDRTPARGLLTLRNDGRWPVRVERVGNQPEAHWLAMLTFRPDANVLNPPNLFDYDGPAFVPFTLGPGEERPVSVALWLDNCEFSAPGTTNTIEAVPVRFRAFGMAHTTWVRLSTPWAVRRGADTACPRSAPRP